ncbi:MAG: hypothetical protein Q9M36_03765 [Sulfurovum sp.]|nr:hypothetical protein [Sulfurovum sp.]
MKKGNFKLLKNENGTKKRFMQFLNSYSVGLFETMIENEYSGENKKLKTNKISWSIEKKEFNKDSVKYFIMCRPGGITILTAIPSLNQYWDSYAKMHNTLSKAANKSCSK